MSFSLKKKSNFTMRIHSTIYIEILSPLGFLFFFVIEKCNIDIIKDYWLYMVCFPRLVHVINVVTSTLPNLA